MAQQPTDWERLVVQEDRLARRQLIQSIIERTTATTLVDTLGSGAKISYNGQVVTLRDDDSCEFYGNGFSIQFHIDSIENILESPFGHGMLTIITLKRSVHDLSSRVFG